jgi:hypothetical protein
MTQRTYYWIGRASPVVFDDMTPRKHPRSRATVRAASQHEAVTKMQARLDAWLAEAISHETGNSRPEGESR